MHARTPTPARMPAHMSMRMSIHTCTHTVHVQVHELADVEEADEIDGSSPLAGASVADARKDDGGSVRV